MSSSSASDTFYQDLKIGLEILVFERLPKHIKRHHYLCFYPRSPDADYISEWGCWCKDVERHPHDYRSCIALLKNLKGVLTDSFASNLPIPCRP
ncbi:hypothetical protein V8C40DRAFT_261966 [Trichoderma camerunense]